MCVCVWGGGGGGGQSSMHLSVYIHVKQCGYLVEYEGCMCTCEGCGVGFEGEYSKGTRLREGGY